MKKKAEPTFAQRHNAISASAGAALSVFNQIAADLEGAANDAADLATDISFEIEALEQKIRDLHAHRNQVEKTAADSRTQANNVRALVGN